MEVNTVSTRANTSLHLSGMDNCMYLMQFRRSRMSAAGPPAVISEEDKHANPLASKHCIASFHFRRLRMSAVDPLAAIFVLGSVCTTCSEYEVPVLKCSSR